MKILDCIYCNVTPCKCTQEDNPYPLAQSSQWVHKDKVVRPYLYVPTPYDPEKDGCPCCDGDTVPIVEHHEWQEIK